MSTAFVWIPRDLRELEANYRDERSSRWMYDALAKSDEREDRAELLRELARYEEKHAGLWERLLRELGRPVPRDTRMWEHRILVRLGRIFGIGAVLPILHRGEVEGIDKYRDQAERWTDSRAQAVFRDILPEEVAHEVETFRAMRESSGKRGALRSSILGANDGLGSILALTAGVAGATSSSPTVVIAGVAGLVAGAVSMAASNYVSVKAEQEGYRSRVRLLREAIVSAPDMKRRQLEELYRAKGLTGEEAEAVVERISDQPEEFLRTLLAEQEGLAEASFEDPGRLGVYTGVAFALAGLVPIVPFLLLPAGLGVLASVGLTAVALFFAGVVRSLSTLSPLLRAGFEMVLVGLGSAAATYVVGAAVGAAVG